MRTTRCLVPALVLAALLAAGAAAAEDEAKPEKKLTLSGEVGLNAYLLRGAYFGSPDQPAADGEYGWLESVARVGLSWSVSDHVSLDVGAAGLSTLSADPFGLDDDGTAVVESAKLAVTDLFTPGLDVTIGRQNLKIGDGFLVQDGYYDDKANIWSIPLTYWDAARVDYRRGDFAGTAFAARLSSSYGYDGEMYGADLAWVPGRKPTDGDGTEEAPNTYVGLSGFTRRDDGEADDDASVLSLRGSAPVGPVTLAGEYALQGGRRAGVSLGGEAWHADARWDLPFDGAPYLFASYLHFSGDDPTTADDESFAWQHYSSEDWSHYYLGEVAGSSLFVNTDLDVLKLEGGVEIGETLSFRLFYLDLRLDTGAYWGSGSGDSLAKEWDAVVTWMPSDATEVWLLYGQARPGSAGAAIYGPDTSNLFSAGFSWSF
jgi:hypothetical protein